jgi:hypothetical protein
MDKALAKKICGDFRPVQMDDGKVKCRFYNDDGICKRPEYFRCELLLHKQQEENKALIGTMTPTSASRISTIMQCPRKYAFNYVYHVEPPIPAQWKVVGRAFSDCSAKIDLGIPCELPKELDSFPVAKAKLIAVLRRYQEWKKDWGPLMAEVRVGIPYKDAYFLGYIDRLTKDRETIIEWKYAMSTYDELKVIRQAATYFKGIPEAKKFVLAVANKPRHKLKKAGKPTKNNPEPKDETPTELAQRIYDEMADKEHEQFMYWHYDREFFDIDGAIEQMYQLSRLIKPFEEIGYPPVFGMACDNCDFRPYCLKHLTQIGCSDARCSHKQICATISKVRDAAEKMAALPENVDFRDEMFDADSD